MRIPRFYVAEALQQGQVIDLPEAVFKHAVKVLRMQEGAALVLFNDCTGETAQQYPAQLVNITNKSAQCQLQGPQVVFTEEGDVSLALAMIKLDKLEWAIQKSVELGVQGIDLLLTDFSVVELKAARLEKKLLHWQKIIENACEQSGRVNVPKINAPIRLSAYLQQSEPPPFVVTSMTQDPSELAALSKTSKATLLIGPEGGWSAPEELLLSQHAAATIRLGSRVLRAETAAVAALAQMQLIQSI